MAEEDAGSMPDDRLLAHYIELHCADSLDGAVASAERWAVRVLARVGSGDCFPYPTAPWFARQIRTELGATRHYITGDEPHKAAWYAIRLGHLIVDARLRGYINGDPKPPVPLLPEGDPPDPDLFQDR